MDVRVGIGYDAHRLVSGRKLILGGVEIPHSKGLKGHSDADVLTHAIIDALLGAAALGDVGVHFPDTDEKYRGVNSLKLLEMAVALVTAENWTICNVDSVIIAQEPKISPYFKEIQNNIATVLGVEPQRIGVKATTTEGMGYEGQKEGISVRAVCLLKR